MSTDVLICLAASGYIGWTYATPPAAPKVARAAPGIPPGVVRLPGAAQVTDCCTFAAGVVLSAGSATFPPSVSWSRLMIADPADPWSAIEELRRHGCTEAPAPVELVGVASWWWCQGWSGLVGGRAVAGASGHTWLCRAPAAREGSPERASGLMLQASRSTGRVVWTERPWTTQAARYDAVRVVRIVL